MQIDITKLPKSVEACDLALYSDQKKLRTVDEFLEFIQTDF